MRRLALLALLVFLALPAAASALAPSVPDGTLAVRNGAGSVWLDNFRGAAIGRVAVGRLVITDPAGGDCTSPLVWGADGEAERRDRKTDELKCVYTGSNIRFRLIGDNIDVRAVGLGISISAVGTGHVILRGDGGLRDGTYVVNGTDAISLPDDGRQFSLAGVPKS